MKLLHARGEILGGKQGFGYLDGGRRVYAFEAVAIVLLKILVTPTSYLTPHGHDCESG